MQELLHRSQTTSEICTAMYHDHRQIRRELLRLHHLGVIEPVGIRTDEWKDKHLRLYEREYLWDLTDHGRYHAEIEPRCFPCEIRRKILLFNAPPL